jgi:transcriptional regulator with XRE-family HTH domain
MDDIRMKPAIGERIKHLRNNALMTQDGLAAAAGVSIDVIRKLEQGRRHTASIRSLHRIAAALDVDLGDPAGSDWATGHVARRRCGRPTRGGRATGVGLLGSRRHP